MQPKWSHGSAAACVLHFMQVLPSMWSDVKWSSMRDGGGGTVCAGSGGRQREQMLFLLLAAHSTLLIYIFAWFGLFAHMHTTLSVCVCECACAFVRSWRMSFSAACKLKDDDNTTSSLEILPRQCRTEWQNAIEITWGAWGQQIRSPACLSVRVCVCIMIWH